MKYVFKTLFGALIITLCMMSGKKDALAQTFSCMIIHHQVLLQADYICL